MGHAEAFGQESFLAARADLVLHGEDGAKAMLEASEDEGNEAEGIVGKG